MQHDIELSSPSSHGSFIELDAQVSSSSSAHSHSHSHSRSHSHAHDSDADAEADAIDDEMTDSAQDKENLSEENHSNSLFPSPSKNDLIDCLVDFNPVTADQYKQTVDHWSRAFIDVIEQVDIAEAKLQ
jgi:hypothetical protein